MPHNNKHAERDWASLPLLPFWMIKDKLDMFDNLCVASVCRDWQSASSSYPKRLSVGDGMPWIMQMKNIFDCRVMEFVSILRNKKFVLDLPELFNSLLLYSKQGWLLMRCRKVSKRRNRCPDSLFLINPFTRAKIEMPDAVYISQEYHGSFSTCNGYPERVVLLNCCLFGQMTLCTAFPGDLSWTKYSYVGHPMQIDGRCGLITIGEKLYYLNFKENMIIFDMATNEWKELPGPRNEIGYTYIVEYEKKIIKLFYSTHEHSHSFYSYNDVDFLWEKLNIDDMKNTSWYLSRNTSCFTAKDKGVKVFQPALKYGGECDHHGFHMSYGFDIVSHDLIEGGKQTLELLCRISSLARWVDIG
ncbi:hypothetical protein POM88_039873 [Heracleum sosnowskyi]|uniref:KIB1-4 beta-propeller domain-containing protein n=1 Tax=Heracleum sosnowskyi TaxID=360622 RepID=A0AAD8HAX2_9APIA|nr:hypothetical protein POM88_039873 [Heracleum sosnowskyi]